jgi:hypothetical protein
MLRGTVHDISDTPDVIRGVVDADYVVRIKTIFFKKDERWIDVVRGTEYIWMICQNRTQTL